MHDQKLKKEIALELNDIGAINFGEFTFVSGIVSPIYIDLRLFISHPKLLKKVAKIYAQQLKPLKYDRLAGVAYAALPIAGAVSLEIEKPWIFMRKEGLKKAYGLKKALEGKYEVGETVVMIEDMVTKATSLLQIIPTIEEQGLIVKDAVVLLDYEKGGRALLKEKGYNLHSFITTREIVEIAKAADRIDNEKYGQCLKFLAS